MMTTYRTYRAIICQKNTPYDIYSSVQLLKDPGNWPMRATWTPFWIFQGQAFLKKSLRVHKISEHFCIAWVWNSLFFFFDHTARETRFNPSKALPRSGYSLTPIWNISARFSDAISHGNQWWRRQMWAVSLSYRPGTRNNCLKNVENWTQKKLK